LLASEIPKLFVIIVVDCWRWRVVLAVTAAALPAEES
jgi:hypothetical protein